MTIEFLQLEHTAIEGRAEALLALRAVGVGKGVGAAGRHEARLRQDVAEISRWREAVRANRLAKETHEAAICLDGVGPVLRRSAALRWDCHRGNALAHS